MKGGATSSEIAFKLRIWRGLGSMVYMKVEVHLQLNFPDAVFIHHFNFVFSGTNH